MKPKRKNFGLFQCFEPISKHSKQTDLFHNKPKQTETTLNYLKNSQIYSLLNWVGLLFVLVQSNSCFGIEAKQLKQTISKQTEKNEKNEKKTKKTRKKPKKTKKPENPVIFCNK
jgi:hypothetical protein